MKEYIENLSEKDLVSPPPHRDKVPPFFQDTHLSELLASYIAHAFTHIGQIIEIRRMLGKDITKINE